MVAKVKTLKLEDGTVVEFPRFTLDHMGELADLFKTEIKNDAVKSAREEKLSSEQIFNLKSNIDSKVVDISQLYAAARSPKWIKLFLKKSLTIANVPADKQDEILSKMSLNDKLDVSEKLVLDMPEIENKNEEGKTETSFTGMGTPVTSTPT